MKTNMFKKATAVFLGTAMLAGSTLTAFAADETTAGTGQILDYKIQTQVVPTAMKVAINPNGYKINLRYKKLADDASFNANEKYYKVTDGVYSVDTLVTSDNFSTKKASLYTADVSNAQIVSFNYGLANTSTVDRKITVKLDVEADPEVEFVDTAAKATATAAADDGGAEEGEYKIFLKLIPAKAGEPITTDTYAKATTYDEDAKYFTRNASNVYAEATVADAEAFAAGTYYVKTTTIGTEILNSELGDVTMQESTVPITFAAGKAAEGATKSTTNADVAYKLAKATYTLKPEEFIDFSTTSQGLADKFNMTAIGGISGFTIAGTMNTNTEWSQLENSTIKITPTYKFEDAGITTAITTGLNQVEADARTYTVTYKPNFTPATGSAPADQTETVAAGSNATGKIDDEDVSFEREGFVLKGWGTAADATADDKVTVTDITSATTLYAIWEEATIQAYLTFEQVGSAGTYYMMLEKAEGTGFGDSFVIGDVVSFTINDVDVKAYTNVSSAKYLAIKWSDVKTALEISSVSDCDSYEAVAVIGEDTYTATYTPQ